MLMSKDSQTAPAVDKQRYALPMPSHLRSEEDGPEQYIEWGKLGRSLATAGAIGAATLTGCGDKPCPTTGGGSPAAAEVKSQDGFTDSTSQNVKTRLNQARARAAQMRDNSRLTSGASQYAMDDSIDDAGVGMQPYALGGICMSADSMTDPDPEKQKHALDQYAFGPSPLKPPPAPPPMPKKQVAAPVSNKSGINWNRAGSPPPPPIPQKMPAGTATKPVGGATIQQIVAQRRAELPDAKRAEDERWNKKAQEWVSQRKLELNPPPPEYTSPLSRGWFPM